MNRHFPLAGLALAASVMLSACGGGSNSASDDAPPARGTVILGQLGGKATTTQIDAGTSSKNIQTLTGAAKCDVDVHYVYYMTRDPGGNPATASTAVLLPTGTNAACTGNRPVLLYAHGTTTTKSFNMAQVTTNTEASLVMAFYAAQGFIVVAPNYLGYDRSGLNYTPYLNAEASAVDMIDGLRAAKSYLSSSATTTQPSTKLLVAGYSQGGHVAMATQKVLERDYASEFTVTASGPMSGPYNLVGFGDTIVSPSGQVNAGATLFLPLMMTSFQKAYGNIYSATTDVYQSPYAATAETLFPTDTPLTDLIAAGKLPNDGGTFTKLFGTGGLLTDTFRAGYATSNFRKALQTNTLLNWSPQHPVALCGGANDPTVFYAVNTPVAKTALGARVTAFNLEDATSVGPTVNGGFKQAQAAVSAAAAASAPTDPTAGPRAVQAQYHGTLVPPFCNAVVRGYFQSVLAAGG
ncbi:alpha/beta hydrolase family protein [Roseateles terrae]|uniref:Pimeloyl-ACP methyl ester carboxylesterase n=1 Tax=Roseateles terrae TaxID=431060 RepID=A0ABR6GS14_9BURK|nr:lipase family protein [Roseateles terrae]MBB3194506.1 pimeloyl-ACP methyl ester carboxylesterase [Roseateles terrae]